MANDIFEYIYKKYKEENELKDNTSNLAKERHATKLSNIEAFLEYARASLLKNPPVAFDYRSKNMGVIFRNNDRAEFLADDQDVDGSIYEPEVPVTSMSRDYRYLPGMRN